MRNLGPDLDREILRNLGPSEEKVHFRKPGLTRTAIKYAFNHCPESGPDSDSAIQIQQNLKIADNLRPVGPWTW